MRWCLRVTVKCLPNMAVSCPYLHNSRDTLRSRPVNRIPDSSGQLCQRPNSQFTHDQLEVDRCRLRLVQINRMQGETFQTQMRQNVSVTIHALRS